MMLIKHIRVPNNIRENWWKIFSLLFALNYFAFRTELFSEEFEQNNPVRDLYTHQVGVSSLSLNWETFDKDNATKAFVIKPPIKILIIGFIPVPNFIVRSDIQSSEPIRDKSPPPHLILV